MKKIYLDYAAATPMAPEVLAVMQPYFSDKFYNPSASYLSARSVKRELEDIRAQVAQVLGAKPAEIVFTAGATEANNLAIQGIAGQYPRGEILTSSIEHDSVLEPALLFKAKQIPVDEQGIIKLDLLSNLVGPNTVLVSVMLVNNELGSIQPLNEVSRLVKQVLEHRRLSGNQTPLYLHTDAAQAGNYLDLHTARLGIDLMSLNGGKIYGPKQSGCLYIRAGLKLQPQIVGGGQEFNLRSGTENVAAAAGFAAGLELAIQMKRKEAGRLSELREYFEKLLGKEISSSTVNAQRAKRTPHIVSLTIKGIDNERVMMELDERGIECAVGSACSASSDEPSHVLSAIGLSKAQARSTLRFSLGRFTTKADIERAVNELAALTVSNR